MIDDDYYQPSLITLMVSFGASIVSIALLNFLNIYTFDNLSYTVVLLPLITLLLAFQIRYNEYNFICAAIFLIYYWFMVLVFFLSQKQSILFFELLMTAQFILVTLDFFSGYWYDYISRSSGTYTLTPEQWHLTFVRIAVGFSLLPLFTEPLFNAVNYSNYEYILFTLEFFLSLFLVTGFFMRGIIFLFIFYLILFPFLNLPVTHTLVWTNFESLWEYPLFWLIIATMYGINGAGFLSLDHVLANTFTLGSKIKFFMANDADDF